jgi:hypothetical protein
MAALTPALRTRLVRAAVMGLLAKVPQGLLLFVMGEYGVFLAMGLRLEFPLNALYSSKHLALGAAFGLLFAVPVWTRRSNTVRGLLVGLAHAAGTLFFFNPVMDGVGIMGLQLGPLMPPLVIVSNLVWGVLAGAGIDLWNRVAAEAEPTEG